MATGYLSLSNNAAGATSTWTGTKRGTAQGETIVYSTPTTNSQTIAVTIPEEMRAATINSATLTYTGAGGSGTKRVCYLGGSVSVTDANLLETVRSLVEAGSSYEFSIYFSFKATGGSGGEGTHSASYYWRDISIQVDYTPAAALTQSITVGAGGEAVLSVKDPSLAYGESTVLSLIARPSAAITGWTVEVRPGSLASADTYQTARTIASGGSGSAEYTMQISAEMHAAMVDRVYAGQVRVTFLTSDGSYSSDWVSCTGGGKALKLVKTRAAPVISAVTWGESGSTHLSDYGAYVAGKTVPTVSFSVTYDTDADADIAASSKSISVGNTNYTLSADGGTLGTLAAGTVSYTVSVTDTRGQTGTYSSTVSVLSYTPPTMAGVAINRYVSTLDTHGQTVYELDDDGVNLWFDAEISCQTTLGTGTNAWSLVITPDGDSDIAVETDSQLATKSYVNDRSVISATYANNAEWGFTVTLTDTFTTVTVHLTVPKAGGILNIEVTGVAVGKRSGGTAATPLFEVAYETHFGSKVYDENGLEINGAGYTPPDTGWVAITLDSTCTQASGWATCAYRVIQGIVYIRGAVYLAASMTSSASTSRTLFTLPSEACPAANMLCHAGPRSNIASIEIDSDGSVKLWNRLGAALGTTEVISLTATYPAA